MLYLSMLRSLFLPYRALFLFFGIGLTDCVLILAYCPALADSLEPLLIVQPASEPLPSLLPENRTELLWDFPAACQPAVMPAHKAALDDDTPVIGVYAAGRARAYLMEAFTHGPGSHLVNDVLGGVPISVTHCDVSGCTRVFTGAATGQPLDLIVGGQKDSGLLLKYGGHLYRQETSALADPNGSTFPYREYPVSLTLWGDWRRAHPETDVYMGTIEEATPPEAGGPRLHTRGKPSSRPPQPS